MSIASEITRLQTSKADVKTQVNIDKDIINGGTAFIDDETLDDYDDKIAEMQEAYKKFIPIQTTSGTEITLDNSSNDKALVNIGLDGNTEQYTTTGKNLFDYTKISSIQNGTIEDGIITISNTSYTNMTLSFPTISLSSGTYYISADIKANSGIKDLVQINDSANLYDEVTKPTLSTTYQRYLFKKTYSGSYSLNKIFINFSTAPGIVEVKNIMVSTSSDATYEPYTGGIASPNPDYPQDVQVVTGENTINLMGRNLLDESTLRDGTYNGFVSGIRVFYDANYYLEAGTYTIVTNNNTDFKYCVVTADSPFPTSTTKLDTSWKTSQYTTFTVSESQKGYFGVIVAKPNGTDNITVADLVGVNYMVYSGSYDSSIPYSPYQSQSYPISLASKNIFDYSSNMIASANIDSTQMKVVNDNSCKVSYVKCKPNTTYTISRRNPMSTRLVIATTESLPQVGTSLLSFVANYDDTTTSTTITTTANAHYIIVRFIYNEVNDYETYAKTIQVEKGSTASSYEDFWQIELCKIGDYKDKIYNNDNDKKWYLRKETSKVIAEGTNYKCIYLFSNGCFIVYDTAHSQTLRDCVASGLDIGIKSNYLKSDTYHNVFDLAQLGICGNNSNEIVVNLGITSSKEDVNTWLSTHNLIIYYPLATPTVTEITDENLISQLEAVKLLSGTQNNFTIDADTLPTLNLNYIGEASSHL